MSSILRDNQVDKTKITGGLLKFYQDLLVEKIIPYQLGIWESREPLKALKKAAGHNVPDAREGGRGGGIGSTLLEAIGFSLTFRDNPELRAKMDAVMEAMADCQMPSGYLNLGGNPEYRFMSLMHGSDGCGLIGGLITYYLATKNETALKLAKGIADCAYEWLGPEEDGKIQGYGGHPGSEMAIFRLYQLTGEKKYLELSKYFIDERGQTLPNGMHYYDWEQQRNIKKFGMPQVPRNAWADKHRPYFGDFEYFVAHKPARDMEEPIGHAVRAMYFYAAMADIAGETDDVELLAACKKIWHNTVSNNIFLNGGVGQDWYWEGIGKAYDLPPDMCYTETCAAIGFMLFTHRMLMITPESHYADAMERTFYNAVLSGVELDGEHYFYVNPLEMTPQTMYRWPKEHSLLPQRYEWWNTPCCPPNIARTIGGISQYIYLYDDHNLWVNLYADNKGSFCFNGQEIAFSQHTDYPLDGKIVMKVEGNAEFALRLRIPGWCKKATLSLNGTAMEICTENGYAVINRSWSDGDSIELNLELAVRRVYPNPRIMQAGNKVAFMRGPILYCIEEEDNGPLLSRIAVSPDTPVEEKYEKDLLGGVYTLGLDALRLTIDDCDELYRVERPAREVVRLKMVPYYLWANRNEGEMRVYIDELVAK